MNLEKLSMLASRRFAIIGQLERELAAERSVNRALSKLKYSPVQDPYVMGGLKRALKLRDRILASKP